MAAGALLAGPLAKRSEWLHSWNRRFCVLTTEELAWHRDTGSSGADGVVAATGESRAVRIHSRMRLVARDGVLLLQPGKEPASSLWFSAASAPELQVWHRTLRNLIDELETACRIAKLHVHENASRVQPAPFHELPHLGTRNLRRGAISKLYYLCAATPSPPKPDAATAASAPGAAAPAAGATEQPPKTQSRRDSGLPQLGLCKIAFLG